MKGNLRRRVKDAIKAAFYQAGWVVYRRPDPHQQDDSECRPLVEDPIEAMHLARSGIDVAFRCPLDKCVLPLGWGYSKDAWGPHVEAAREIVNGRVSSASESVLRRYYDCWQPPSAGSALPKLPLTWSRIAGFPGYAVRCSPWRVQQLSHLLKQLEEWWENDAEEHSGKRLSVRYHGTKMHGPVSEELLRLEFERLRFLVEVFLEESYDRTHGEIQVTMLRREGDVRFLKTGPGYHRTAVYAALRHDIIPAVFRNPSPVVVDIHEIEEWPQVRRGVWERNEAEAYFHHLFDLDSRAWARERGLLREMDSLADDPQGKALDSTQNGTGKK